MQGPKGHHWDPNSGLGGDKRGGTTSCPAPTAESFIRPFPKLRTPNTQGELSCAAFAAVQLDPRSEREFLRLDLKIERVGTADTAQSSRTAVFIIAGRGAHIAANLPVAGDGLGRPKIGWRTGIGVKEFRGEIAHQRMRERLVIAACANATR